MFVISDLAEVILFWGDGGWLLWTLLGCFGEQRGG